MAATLKAEWNEFPSAERVDFTVYRAGVVLYTVGLDGSATVQEFFAADYSTLPYAAHAQGVYPAVACSLSVVGGGSGGGGGSSEGGGG